MSSPSYESIHAAFNNLLTSLGIPTKDTAIFDDTQNNPFKQPKESKADYVTEIDHLTSSLSAISETIVHITSTRIGNLNKCRNLAVSPMHHLPTEVFNEMMFYSTNGPMKYAYLRDLGSLRSVCTRWASQILSNKTLWAFIWDHPISDMFRKPHQVQQLLNRSGAAPLSIRFGCNSIELIPEVFPLLMSQTHRIKSIQVELHHAYVELFLSEAMPALESLHLWVSSDREPGVIKNFLGGYAPRLRVLVTSYLFTLASVDPYILAGLEELYIIHTTDAEHANEHASTIMTIAATCPVLKSLQIHYSISDPSIPVHLPDTYALPSLESLDLVCSPHPTCTFLQAIIAPKCKSYRVNASGFHGAQEDQLQLLLSHACSSFLEDEKGVVLQIVKDKEDYKECLSIRPYGGDNPPRLSIVDDAIGAAKLLLAVATMGIHKVVRVETPISTIHGSRSPTDFVTEMPCVEELAIRTGHYGEEVTLAALVRIVRAYRQRSDSAPPPLESLRTLEIWERGGWVNKFDEVMAALALEANPMDSDVSEGFMVEGAKHPSPGGDEGGESLYASTSD